MLKIKKHQLILLMRDSRHSNVPQMNITDYLNESERLYHEIQRFEMSLPSAVLAYHFNRLDV